MKQNKFIKNLNEEQLQAVTHKNGPLLIIAGAGTGKTRVIAHRVAYLIEQKIAKPSEILALTFTDKAAEEMEIRIDQLVPLGTYGFTACTFHSFCQEVLKNYGIIAGFSPDFELLTEPQQIFFIRQNFDNFNLNLYKPITNPNKFITALVKLFSHLKDENISVNDYQKLATSSMQQATRKKDDPEIQEQSFMIQEQANAYKTYERLKTKHNYLDFGDLLEKTLWLMQNRKTILNSLQNKYKYIFVDEFQDTNYTQARIAYLLSDKYKNITVVGDDDQSIYKFRGASISNIMEFVKYFPKTKKIVLNKNYRSTQAILDLAHTVIKNNNPNRLEVKEKINKKLVGQIKGEKPQYWHFDHNSNEIKNIVEYIQNQISKDQKLKRGPSTKLRTEKFSNKNFSDFAILVRSNKDANDFIEELKHKKIPFKFIGNRGLYDREEIRELISYLKVLANPDDNLSLFHLAFSNKYHIDKILLRRLSNYSKQKNKSLFDIIENLKSNINNKQLNLFNIKEQNETSLKKIVELVKYHLEVAKIWPTSKILVDYIFKSGMYKEISKIENYESQEKVENIRLFFRKISEFEKISDDKSLFSFIEYLKLIIEAGDNPPVFESDKFENALSIMTIHGAKGLEFDTIFIPYLTNKKFPSTERKEQIEMPEKLLNEKLPKGDIHLEEERRLFYVAATRAKNKLIISSSNLYNNSTQIKKVSLFVLEAKDTLIKQVFDQKENLDFLKINKDNNKSIQISSDEILKLSPSNLENFADCPKKFEYSFIYRIKTDSSQATSFGDSVHNTLRDCYTLIMNNQKLSDNTIKSIYKKCWKEDGFTSKQEENRCYNTGLDAIINYIQNDKIVPEFIEERFKYKINTHCEINGRIDRINKDGLKFEIIDYKTSDGRKKEKAEITKNLPLWIYTLWTKEKFKADEILLSLNYIINNKVLTSTVKPKTLESKREKIIEICDNIKNAIQKNDFPAKPTEQKCKWCNYKTVCPHKAKNA